LRGDEPNKLGNSFPAPKLLLVDGRGCPELRRRGTARSGRGSRASAEHAPTERPLIDLLAAVDG
jgi:hypothetical protein